MTDRLQIKTQNQPSKEEVDRMSMPAREFSDQPFQNSKQYENLQFFREDKFWEKPDKAVKEANENAALNLLQEHFPDIAIGRLKVDELSNIHVSCKDKEGNTEAYIVTPKYVLKKDNGNSYSGYLADGTEVHGSFESGNDLSLELRNGENKVVLTAHSSVYGKQGKDEYTLLRYQTYNAREEVVTEESYLGADGSLLEIREPLNGIIRVFDKGELVSSDILDIPIFCKNIKNISSDPHFLDLMNELSVRSPDQVIASYSEFKEHSDFLKIMESAIGRLSIESVMSAHKDLHSGKGNEISPDFFKELSKEQLVSLHDLLSFRQKMLVEGGALARTLNPQNNRFPELSEAAIFPKNSRGYFEIDPKDVNRQSSRLDVNDPKLSEMENRLLTARLLYERNEKISPETVDIALNDIYKLRDLYSDTKLIHGRNVVMLAGSESIADLSNLGSEYVDKTRDQLKETKLWGRQALQEGIKEGIGTQGQGSFKFYRPDLDCDISIERLGQVLEHPIIKEKDGVKRWILSVFEGKSSVNTMEVAKVLGDFRLTVHQFHTIISELRGGSEAVYQKLHAERTKAIDALIDTPPPFTFIYTGGGDESRLAIYYGALGEDVNSSKSDEVRGFSYEDLAKILKSRAKKWGEQLKKTPDIVILDSQYQANLIDNIKKELGQVQNTIFMGPSEYGQEVINYPQVEYGSLYFPHVLGIRKDREGDPSTFGDAIKNQFYDSKEDKENKSGEQFNRSNPSFFVPDGKGNLIQVSSTDKIGLAEKDV